MNRLDFLLEQGIKASPSESLLNVTFKEANEGQSICHWHITPEQLNGNGTVLGGFITAAADIGMAYALLSVVKPDIAFTSISIQSTYHRPGTVGEAEIRTVVKKLGKTIAYVESEVYQRNRVIATITSSLMLIKAP